MRAALVFSILLAHLAPALAAPLELDLVAIPGASLVVGDAAGEPDEAPKAVTVAPFRLMRFEVTNAEFAAFVAATGHRTDPEARGAGYVWPGRWRLTEGADWRHPSASR